MKEKKLREVNFGDRRATQVEVMVAGSVEALAGNPDGSTAYGILHAHAESFLKQLLLGRGFEKYNGKEIEGTNITRSRKDTADALVSEAEMKPQEAKIAIKAVEDKVKAAVTAVLGEEIAH